MHIPAVILARTEVTRWLTGWLVGWWAEAWTGKLAKDNSNDSNTCHWYFVTYINYSFAMENHSQLSW